MVTITLRGDKETITKFNYVRDTVDTAAMLPAIEEAIDRSFIPALKQKIQQENIVFKRDLFNAVDRKRKSVSKGNIIIEWGVFGVPYAADIEFGRRPIPKNLGSLEQFKEWVQRKLGIADDSAASIVAFRIRNKIRKHGVKKHPYMMPVYQANKSYFVKLYESILRRQFASKYRI